MDPVFHTLTLLPPPWLNLPKVNHQTHVVGFLSLGYHQVISLIVVLVSVIKYSDPSLHLLEIVHCYKKRIFF
ncbi:hypothetical protein Hanom_Chr04g00294721 [Helianthus anomalus]